MNSIFSQNLEQCIACVGHIIIHNVNTLHAFQPNRWLRTGIASSGGHVSAIWNTHGTNPRALEESKGAFYRPHFDRYFPLKSSQCTCSVISLKIASSLHAIQATFFGGRRLRKKDHETQSSYWIFSICTGVAWNFNIAFIHSDERRRTCGCIG